MHSKSEHEHAHQINPPPSADSRFAGFSEQLRPAQAEISPIRLERQVEKKPRWRQAAVVISVIGLLLSSGFSLYTALDRVAQRRAVSSTAKIERLAGAIGAVVRNQDLLDHIIRLRRHRRPS